MTTLLTIIHILVSVFLVVIVLLQHGKGADIGATFGGASQTLFGTEGPLPLLNKVTTGAAIVFMATSLSLAYISAHPGKGSVMQAVTPPAATPPPTATPTAPTVPTEPVTVPATESSATFPGTAAGNGERAQADGGRQAAAPDTATAPEETVDRRGREGGQQPEGGTAEQATQNDQNE